MAFSKIALLCTFAVVWAQKIKTEDGSIVIDVAIDKDVLVSRPTNGPLALSLESVAVGQSEAQATLDKLSGIGYSISDKVASIVTENEKLIVSGMDNAGEIEKLNTQVIDLYKKLQMVRARKEAKLVELQAALGGKKKAMEEDNNRALATIDSERSILSNKIGALEDALTEKALEYADESTESLATDMDARLASLDPINRKIFVGGALSWGGGYSRNSLWGKTDSWRLFEIDRVDLNSGKDTFDIIPGGFQVKEDGLYRLLYWGIVEGGNCHHHARVFVDSTFITDHYHVMTNWGGNWKDMHIDLQWPLKKGQTIGITFYGCGQRWHESQINNEAAYNRITFEKMGSIGKCVGPFCKGTSNH